ERAASQMLTEKAIPAKAAGQRAPDIAAAPGPSGIAAPRALCRSLRSTAQRLRSARAPCSMPAVPECLPHWRVQQHPPAWDPPIGKADLHCTTACRWAKSSVAVVRDALRRGTVFPTRRRLAYEPRGHGVRAWRYRSMGGARLF